MYYSCSGPRGSRWANLIFCLFTYQICVWVQEGGSWIAIGRVGVRIMQMGQCGNRMGLCCNGFSPVHPKLPHQVRVPMLEIMANHTHLIYCALYISVSPSAQIAVWRYWFRLSHLSMMVIGSFASYTKTKSVESAV